MRRSLKLPVILAVVMIVLLVVLTIGWVWLTILGILSDSGSAGLYWTFLAIGAVFLITVLAGVIASLTLSINAIGLTQRQSNFIDAVTHELKSPIASLKLYLQTLDLRTVNEADRASFYRFMLDDVERLDRLINHILDAGHLDKPKQSASVEVIDLAELIGQSTQMVLAKYRAPESIITLSLEPCLVEARRIDLDIIFRNLIDNAVKYAANDPKVVVELTYVAEGWAVCRIRDNGKGIPPHLRRRIFRRFVRLGQELEREKPGTGLGLYLVRTLVRRLKGRILIQDTPDNIGTQFEVRLPARRLTAPSGSARSGDSPATDVTTSIDDLASSEATRLIAATPPTKPAGRGNAS